MSAFGLNIISNRIFFELTFSCLLLKEIECNVTLVKSVILIVMLDFTLALADSFHFATMPFQFSNTKACSSDACNVCKALYFGKRFA